MNELRVLVMDDDLDYTALMQMRLESWGHDVTVANNWFLAMTLMSREDFDVMLIDVDTPTGNGLTACNDLCCDQKIAEAKKVFITGRSDAETIQRCRDLNAQYIHKGTNVFDELRTVLEDIKPASLIASS